MLLTGSMTPITLSYMEAMTSAEQERQGQIVLARKYHYGLEGAKLTSRMIQFLGEDVPFTMNVVGSVVSAVAERLRVMGFDSSVPELMTWALKVWTKNKMPARQEDIYEAALLDGEHFVIVGWDNEEEYPTFTAHPRYTSVDVGGDGEGCWVVYEQNDPNQKPLYGVKVWNEYDSSSNLVVRQTRYYSDRIERYIRRAYESEFSRYVSDGAEWPIPWVRKDGKPLGVALKPFNNKGLACEAWKALPLQRALDKSLVDLLTSSDTNAFRVFYALGFIPTTDGKAPKEDGSNLIEVEPGTIIATSKNRRDAEFGSIAEGKLAEQMDLAHQIVLWMAMVTNTPISRFISTRLVASDSTLKEQETPLIARVNARQERFADSWIECFNLARELSNLYGEAVPEGDIKIKWAEAAARGEQEKLTILAGKKNIGVPQEQLWVEDGYDQPTIARMKKMQEESVKLQQEQMMKAAGNINKDSSPDDESKQRGGRDARTGEGSNDGSK